MAGGFFSDSSDHRSSVACNALLAACSEFWQLLARASGTPKSGVRGV
jgi:hypothetical protein